MRFDIKDIDLGFELHQEFLKWIDGVGQHTGSGGKIYKRNRNIVVEPNSPTILPTDW